MTQSLLNVFTVFLQSYENPIIMVSLAIFAATFVVYLVKRMMYL